MKNPLKYKGISLVETLVALVFVTLIMGAIVGLLMGLFNMRVRFRDTTDNFNEAYLGPMWFQRSVENMFFTKTRLDGDDKKFTGVTTYPLFGDIGEPHTFTWELEEDSKKDTYNLYYKGIETQTALVEVFRGKNIYFEYYDGERNDWVKDWRADINDQKPKFPLYIRITGYENSKVTYFSTLEPSRKVMKIEMLKAQNANYEKEENTQTKTNSEIAAASSLSGQGDVPSDDTFKNVPPPPSLDGGDEKFVPPPALDDEEGDEIAPDFSGGNDFTPPGVDEGGDDDY